MATEGEIELTIRCAMQTFPDRTMHCSGKWTVLQLKEHLFAVCESKPEVARQRLIYAGHCLENAQTLESVLRGRSASDASSTTNGSNGGNPQQQTQVIHLVYSAKDPLGAGGVRLRKTAQRNSSALPTATPAMAQPPVQPQQAQQANFHYGNAFYGYPQQPQAQGQQPQNAYEAYAASYQNYINQMLYYQQQQFHQMVHQQQHPGVAAAMMPQMLPAGQAPQLFQQFQPMAGAAFGAAAAFGGAHLHPNQIQQGNNNGQAMMANPFAGMAMPAGFHGQFQVQAQVPIADPAPAPEVVGGAAMDDMGVERQPDLLDFIYKAIRFSLLMMVLYMYSSVERFLMVLAVVMVVWFVQMRRERQNRMELQQREIRRLQAVQQPVVPAIGEADAPPADNNNNNELTPDRMPNAPPTTNIQQTVWNVFWSTVSSFFTSLIPENPGPLNVN